MDELTLRLREAREDNAALDALIADYQPFIRQEAQKVAVAGLELEDRLSIAALVFMQCVRQYSPERGGFIGYAATCIRNRLLDEGRKGSRQAAVIPLFQDDAAGEVSPAEQAYVMEAYDRGQERQSLADEMDALSEALGGHGLSLSMLETVCPRQKRSRTQCAQLAHAVAADALLRDAFGRTGRLPQAELAVRFRISPKTIEKHRRYIVALVVILLGDYPGIRSFLPQGGKQL